MKTFDWQAHYNARVKQAAGNPDERIELDNWRSVPRYCMADNGRIWDDKAEVHILGSFSEEPTKFEDKYYPDDSHPGGGNPGGL